jgi:hypothetical protein
VSGAGPRGRRRNTFHETTVDSFDGSSIKGTFSGAFETPGQPGGPAAVRNGKFNLALGTS